MLYQSEGLQPEEVHLHESAFLYLGHRILRGDRSRLRICIERHIVVKILPADDNACGMEGGVPAQSLKTAGCVEELCVDSAAALYLLEPRFFVECLCQRHLGIFWNQGTDLVGFLVWDIKDTGNIFHNSLWLERSERDDLSNPVLTVMLRNVVDNLAPAFEAEVNIEIRERYAFRIEEPLEEQVVLYRIDVGDCYRICDKGTSAASSSRSDRNSVGLCPVDVIPDNEEVGREVHLYDDPELVVQSFLQLIRDDRVPLSQSFICQECEILRI